MRFINEQHGNDRYLVYVFGENDVIETMSYGQITNNRIAGLVPVESSRSKAEKSILYKITSLVSLDTYLQNPVRKQQLLRILASIVSAVASSREYMIGTDVLLFDRKYVFLDPNTLEICLICFPIIENRRNSDLQTFLCRLVTKTSKDKSESREYVADLIEKLDTDEPISLEDIASILQEFDPDGLAAVLSPATAVQHVPADAEISESAPVAIAEEPEPVAEEPEPAADESEPVAEESEPAAEESEPVAEESEPAADESEPVAEEPEPAADESEPAAEESEPVAKKPEPMGEESEPTVEVSGSLTDLPGSLTVVAMPWDQAPDLLAQAGPEPILKQKKSAPGFLSRFIKFPGTAAKSKKGQESTEPAISEEPVAVRSFSDPYRPDPQDVSQPLSGDMTVVDYSNRQMPTDPKPDMSAPSIGRSSLTGGDDTLLQIESDQTILERRDPFIRSDTRSTATLIREKTDEIIPISGTFFMIGSDYGYCDYHISNNKTVGDTHAHIIKRGQDYFIIDIHGQNNTYVNGIAIPNLEEVKLDHGAKIRLGTEAFTFTL